MRPEGRPPPHLRKSVPAEPPGEPMRAVAPGGCVGKRWGAGRGSEGREQGVWQVAGLEGRRPNAKALASRFTAACKEKSDCKSVMPLVIN